jgi:hypothetical protein
MWADLGREKLVDTLSLLLNRRGFLSADVSLLFTKKNVAYSEQAVVKYTAIRNANTPQTKVLKFHFDAPRRRTS